MVAAGGLAVCDRILFFPHHERRADHRNNHRDHRDGLVSSRHSVGLSGKAVRRIGGSVRLVGKTIGFRCHRIGFPRFFRCRSGFVGNGCPGIRRGRGFTVRHPMNRLALLRFPKNMLGNALTDGFDSQGFEFIP